MKPWFPNFAGCITLCSLVLLSGCMVPIPIEAPKLVPAVSPVQVVPVPRVAVPVVAPVTPPVVAPVTPQPVVPATTCNIFGTECPATGGGDGGELPPDWQG